jgi:hypothetical protein
LIEAKNVSAVIVTRGDVDITTIVNSMPFDDVVVWDNSVEEDLQCYGRFAGIERCKNDIIYVQDDDVLIPVPSLLREYEPGDVILANRKPDEEYRFLGVGALFPAASADVFSKYLAVHPKDKDFYRAADVVFAEMNRYRSVWLGYAEFEWSRADNRMYKQPGHYEVRDTLINRARAL